MHEKRSLADTGRTALDPLWKKHRAFGCGQCPSSDFALNHIDQTPEERLTVLCILILLGCAFLVGAFLVILLLKVLLDVAEFVLTALLTTVILIFHHPALGIAFAFALIAFVILIARWAGA